jgi:hypothetical protein
MDHQDLGNPPLFKLWQDLLDIIFACLTCPRKAWAMTGSGTCYPPIFLSGVLCSSKTLMPHLEGGLKQVTTGTFIVRILMSYQVSTENENRYQSGVTFSGFLNALDGVASGEERILFMTTNHLDLLDPALIRPGRVDVLELIDDASPAQARQLFTLFYRIEGGMLEVEKMAETFERIMREEMEKGKRVSMAALQGLFIQNEAAIALAKCRDLLVERS